MVSRMDKRTSPREENPQTRCKKIWRMIVIVVAAVVLATVVAALLIFNDLFSRMKAPPTEETLPQATDVRPEKAPAEKAPAEKPRREEEMLPPVPEISGETDAELETAIQETLQNIQVEIPNTDGVMTVLLLGNDTRDVPLEQRTDCLFLASVNQNTRQILLVSVPRELSVYVSDWGRTDSLLSACVNGGPALTAKTVAQNFGVAIDAYLSISFESFEHAVDTFGGVDMALSADDLSALTDKVSPRHQTVPIPIIWTALRPWPIVRDVPRIPARTTPTASIP